MSCIASSSPSFLLAAMSSASAVTVVERELPTLSAKVSKEMKETEKLLEFIIAHAQDVADSREHFGEDATAKLFLACEENMRAYLRGSTEQHAIHDALSDISTRVNRDMPAADVKAAFLTSVKERSAKSSDEQALLDGSKEYRRLKVIIEKSNQEASGHGSAAGPSGSTAEDMQVEEEGFAMTQTTRSTKCPLLQVEMTEKGELRPMRAGCPHVFSWKGLQESLKGGRNRTMKCPIPGCQAVLSLANLTEDKETAREIRRRVSYGELN